MHYIFLSPHLDDAVYSCGGIIWEWINQHHQVEIWTICAGDPPAGELSPFAESLHSRWRAGAAPVKNRRAEDVRACLRLGAGFRHFPIPDCIYRLHPETGNPLYPTEKSIFGPVDPAETGLIRKLQSDFSTVLQEGTRLVCPLSLGGHVDHRLVRRAAEGLSHPLWFYADYPYVMENDTGLAAILSAGWRKEVIPVSKAAFRAWADSTALYSSQFSTFWGNQQQMEGHLRAYIQKFNGVCIWVPPEERGEI